ncbi:MAG: glycosyltransferase family 2 protein [bacterium]
MKITIIVPVYNVEKYISRCFLSISKQIYNEIECFFIDDCSSDDSLHLLQKLVSNYKGPIKFSIIKHEKNEGLSRARNTGTHLATGEYIYYLDSDDDITPSCIKNLVELAVKFKNVDIVQGATNTVPQPAGRNWRDIRGNNFPQFSNDRIWIRQQFFRKPNIPVNAWNKLIRRQFLLNNNLLFKEGLVHEDELWMFSISKKIESIAFCEEPCYNHYIVPGSIIQSNNNHRRLDSMLAILSEMANNIDTEVSAIQRKYIYKLINNSLDLMTTKEYKNHLRKYRTLIRRFLAEAIQQFYFFESLILLTLLIPNIYKTRRISELLIEHYKV